MVIDVVNVQSIPFDKATGDIETRENVAQFFHVFADHASRVVVFIETFQAFVADRADQFPP
jgi:hypothetical protein